MDILINAGIGICYTQENPPLEEVFAHLKYSKQGLSSDEESEVLKILGFMWNPLSGVMEAAALLAIGLAHGGPRDYHDFVGILVLLVINSTISFIEENNAGNAAAALMARPAPKAKEPAMLVLGDIVSIKLEDIVTADARFLEGGPLKIDQDVRICEDLGCVYMFH
ncbi:hypothetical protein RJ639_027192, partial [Escallonia herrerae]